MSNLNKCSSCASDILNAKLIFNKLDTSMESRHWFIENNNLIWRMSSYLHSCLVDFIVSFCWTFNWFNNQFWLFLNILLIFSGTLISSIIYFFLVVLLRLNHRSLNLYFHREVLPRIYLVVILKLILEIKWIFLEYLKSLYYLFTMKFHCYFQFLLNITLL